MYNYLKIFLLSMTPIGELRASIPVAIGVYGMHWLTAYIISVFGNMIPPILIIFFLDKLINFLSNKKVKIAIKVTNFLETQKKKSRLVKTYGIIGLIIFVSIPFPSTGAWTGAFIAFLLNIPKLVAIFSIFSGVCIAGIIVTLASIGVIHIIF